MKARNTSVENTESKVLATSEETSVEESETVEEMVMFSADEVMAHIDTLIAQYFYNDPKHIKALVVAASELDGDMEDRAKNYADYTPVSSGEEVAVSFSKYIYGYDCEYNLYNDYINANS